MIDFYKELLSLIEQIPDGEITSSRCLGEALGDVDAIGAVRDALMRPEFKEASQKNR